MDFRNVDVETMEQYDRVVRLDESKPRPGEEEDLAKKKAQAWKELAERAPSLREQALRRASEWEEHARQLRALKEARIARTIARDKDWAKLSRLLPLRVIPEETKRKWASDFVQAYGTRYSDNPYCAGLRPYLDRGVSCEEPPKPPRGFVLIPAGRFQMGSPDSGLGGGGGEYPIHEVTIQQPFFLKATEVTQGEWKALMGNNPSRFKNCGGSCPVENVSWWDAVAFCNALSRKEGLEECYTLTGCSGTPGEGNFECTGVTFAGLSCKGYRLPTEAEWEYAARAGTTTALYTGGMTLRDVNDAPEVDPIAWYQGNSGVDYEGGYDCSHYPGKQYASSRCGTHPVAKKQPNAWGLFDMLGNVYEWVQDWYHDSYNGAPSDGSAWESPAGSKRVIRGGSWGVQPVGTRVAFRYWHDPGRSRDGDLGFRVARSVP
jgi:formylglycine-generating enzyme required for sulfatase activity